MFRRLALALALLVASCLPATSPALAQWTPRYGMIDDGVKDALTREWDAHDLDTLLTERGICLRWEWGAFGGEPAYRVTAASAPIEVRERVQGGVGFSCRAGPRSAALHTHPQQSCETRTGPCRRGGWYANQCFPSDPDYDALEHSGTAFGVIQCDRRAFVFYFPRRR